MRVEFAPGEDTRIPLLKGGFPDEPVARLEGYNGIGKTLSVKTLQVCCGRQVFRDTPIAWRSFAEGIGHAQIAVHNLAGGISIEWKLRPDALAQADANTRPVDEWFEIKIDGSAATLEQVTELLEVERLDGDLGLAQTLGRQLRVDREIFSASLDPLVDPGGSLLRGVQDRLSRALETTRRVDPETVRSARADAEDTAKRLERAREELSEASRLEEELYAAWRVSAQLEQARKLGAGIDVQVDELDAQIAELRERRDELTGAQKAAEEVAAKEKEVKSTLERTRKRRDRYQSAAEKEREAIVERRVRAKLEEGEDAPAALTAARGELEELTARRVAIEASPLVRDLASELADRLRTAEESGLAEQRLLDVGSGTVREIRQRLEARRDELSEVPPSREAKALDRRIDESRARIDLLEELVGEEAELNRNERLGEKAAEEMKELLEKANPDAADELDAARSSLNELDETLRDIVARRTALVTLRAEAGSETIEDLETALSEKLAGPSIEAGDLDEATRASAKELRAREDQFKAAETADREASERATVAIEELDRALLLLRGDTSFAWLSEIPGLALPDEGEELERRLEAIDAVRLRVEQAYERAGAVGSQIGALKSALERLERRMSGVENEPEGEEYEPELTKGYGTEFLSLFRDPTIEEVLFGEGGHATELDLRRDQLEVAFSRNDEERRRPLEAFSRGEQAFAYTRARLAAIDAVSTASNRLVVLDEFGAFIAADRLERLVELLHERRASHPEEQVLLILPTATDYGAQVEGAADHYMAERAKRLSKDGYVVEPL